MAEVIRHDAEGLSKALYQAAQEGAAITINGVRYTPSLDTEDGDLMITASAFRRVLVLLHGAFRGPGDGSGEQAIADALDTDEATHRAMYSLLISAAETVAEVAAWSKGAGREKGGHL